jgi:hypothetical protein
MFTRITFQALFLIMVVFGITAPQAEAGIDRTETARLWQKLVTEHKSQIRPWIDSSEGTPSAIDVLQAFTGVVSTVTAPGGFWRRDVPSWLGCRAMPSRACERLEQAADTDFRRWDDMVNQITRISDRKAEAFLANHAVEMIRYLDYYVPSRLSGKAMRETGFFSDRLAGAFSEAESPELLF